MGFLRTFLALIVVLGHIRTFDNELATLISRGAVLAVKFFFLLSGFYMSLVLDKKYHHRAFEFYKSRFLRIFPLYWVTILLCLGLFLLPTEINQSLAAGIDAFYQIESYWLKATIIFSNITLLGTDLLAFIYYNGSHIMMFPVSPPSGFNHLQIFLINLPSWMLGIQIVFYVIAPFLFRKGWNGILWLLAISITTRIYIHSIAANEIDWSRQFILSEGVYFAFGMLSYKIYRKAPIKLFTQEVKWLAAFVVFIWTAIYSNMFILNVNIGDRLIWDTLFHWLFMGTMVILIPFLFELSLNSRVDFYVGEFSYPIYITHIPTLQFVLPLFRDLIQDWSYSGKLVFSLGVIFAVAFLGMVLVTYPIEWLRGRTSMQARYASISNQSASDQGAL